ncbi:MAG: hypothetical protein JSS83_20825 [Cyanobacteria bacterium SZAS LIN-3]|nr:hypothetical protein [Cyanobacteria bacterium SZAS LIN-3]MBS2010592.1 hypothetical protein [Cyanobacteria bacterium SZAS TMP-1]
MFESFGFPTAVALFVIGLILLFVGFFLGIAGKNRTASVNDFSKTDWLILGADLVLIAAAVSFAVHDNMAGFVLFIMPAAFVSGALWSRVDFAATVPAGTRWF